MKFSKIINRLKTHFFTGLLILLPVGITVYAFIWSFNLLDGWLRDIVTINGRPIPGLGVFTVLVIVVFVGMLAQNYLGKRILIFVEKILARIPLFSKIYIAAKQVSDSLLLQKRSFFKKVVAIEYPRKGIYSIGFVTGEADWQFASAQGKQEKLLYVYICTTPNPTTGFVIAVPESEIIPLKISVEEGLKLVISAGLITPDSVSKMHDSSIDNSQI